MVDLVEKMLKCWETGEEITLRNTLHWCQAVPAWYRYIRIVCAVDSKQPLIIITYLSYYHYCNDYYLKRSLKMQIKHEYMSALCIACRKLLDFIRSWFISRRRLRMCSYIIQLFYFFDLNYCFNYINQTGRLPSLDVLQSRF